jgi:hypothetical protein
LRWTQTGQSFTAGPPQSGMQIGYRGPSRSERITHFGLRSRPEGAAPIQCNSARRRRVRSVGDRGTLLRWVQIGHPTTADREAGRVREPNETADYGRYKSPTCCLATVRKATRRLNATAPFGEMLAMMPAQRYQLSAEVSMTRCAAPLQDCEGLRASIPPPTQTDERRPSQPAAPPAIARPGIPGPTSRDQRDGDPQSKGRRAEAGMEIVRARDVVITKKPGRAASVAAARETRTCGGETRQREQRGHWVRRYRRAT